MSKIFIKDAEKINDIIKQFIKWWEKLYSLYDKTPTTEQFLNEFEMSYTKYESDVIKKYGVIPLLIEYHDDLYVNGYLKMKYAVIRSNNKFKLENNYGISHTMFNLQRNNIYLQIYRHVFNELCKEEIERQKNKRYALNMMYYNDMLPYDVVFEVSKF